MLNQFSSIGIKDLPINALEIIYHRYIEINDILELHEIFNLEILTTFQLESMPRFRDPYNLGDEIRQLLSNLTNIKHLSLGIPHTRYDGFLDLLKPNSLHSLYLKFSSVDFFSQNILEGQEGSLERIWFCISGICIRDQFRRNNNGIGEMDRILKLNWYRLAPHLKQIGDMVRGGRRFQNLNQVMYNEFCYLIERSTKENISVIPCNLFRSNTSESDFVHTCLYP
ncbi:hypothetical protein JA1_003636 [Spathaspora sp. JA1]|nr:hypothetical protein JA1_003636 [Spathaspora sp. JA1]